MIQRKGLFSTFLLFVFSLSLLRGQLPSIKYFVGDIEFVGNNHYSDARLKKIIKLREPRFLNYQTFNRRSLSFDAITIRTFYESQGFLQAEVKESFEIIGEGRVDILFTIHEGHRSYLRSINFEGNRSISDKSIQKILGLKINKPFDPVSTRRGLSLLAKEYRKIGKIYATFDDRYNLDEGVDFRLKINEGPAVKINQITIEGLERVKSKLVEREFQIDSGMVYDEEKTELTQKRIFETGLFSLVNIYPVKSLKGEDWVNVQLELKEFKTREFISEGGFYPLQTTQGADPLPGIGGTLEWRNRSIFNAGIRFGMKSTVQLPINRVDYLIKKKFPLVLRLQTNLSSNWIGMFRFPNALRIFYEDIPELGQPEDNLRKIGIDWNYLQRFSDESLFRGGLRWSKIISGDTTRIRDSEQERSIRINYRFRRLDNPILPTKGTIFSIESSLVGIFLGGTRDYTRLEMDYRHYFPNKNSWVLAFRLKMGWMEPLSQSKNNGSKLIQIPSYDRFYLGGSTSLRGWNTQMFKPDTSESGEILPHGGLIKLLYNNEVRISIWKQFGINIFLDGGILALSITDFKKELIHWKKGWDYGIELTYVTPLGPVRLYYARQLGAPREPGIWNLGLLYAF